MCTIIPQVSSSRHISFRSYVACPQTQYVKPRAQIRALGAEDILNLPNSHKLTSESHSESEPEQRTMTVLQLIECPGLIEAGVSV
jgi:hypothetical protein